MSHHNQTQATTHRRIRQAQGAALWFAIAFTGWSAVSLILALTISVARSERLGFAFITAAAAVALWTVYAFIGQGLSGDDRPMWPARLWCRFMTRLRTPRH